MKMLIVNNKNDSILFQNSMLAHIYLKKELWLQNV